MSNLIKKLFGTLAQKPWEKEQMALDTSHSGKTFNISTQKSAVIIIFGIATVLFSLIFTAYIYSIPPEQDTRYLLKPNLDELSKIYNEQVTLDNIFEVSYYISKKYNIKFIVTSLGKEGIYLYDKDKNIGEIFSKSYIQQDEVVDVTGAGDIVLAIIANNINNLKEGIVLANKIAQESVKYIGVNI